MRLPRGILKKIEVATGISNVLLCDYVARRRHPGRDRTIVLEKACSKIGLNVPASMWMFGSKEELKSALSEYNSLTQ